MATTKKTFDALAASCRWRRATSRLLNKMTPEEQIAFLNRRHADGVAVRAVKTAGEQDERNIHMTTIAERDALAADRRACLNLP